MNIRVGASWTPGSPELKSASQVSAIAFNSGAASTSCTVRSIRKIVSQITTAGLLGDDCGIIGEFLDADGSQNFGPF